MIHGGDIYRNEIELDFSVNVNPMGMPASVREALIKAVEDCQTYPDIQAEQLRMKIAAYHQLQPGNILCGNGASEIFMALMQSIRPGKVVIPAPSFLGYAYAAKACASEVIYYKMEESKNFGPDEEIFEYLTSGVQALFLANPNNPVGNTIDPQLLERILVHCETHKIWVILDECFLDFTEHAGAKTCISKIHRFKYLVIIRAFTKIFAIPGVRLGYMISGSEAFVSKVACCLPEWNLSTFAQAAGVAALDETQYLKDSVEVIKRERDFLTQGLRKAGCQVFPGEADFIFIKTERPLYTQLLKEKILIRDCSNYIGLTQGFYRIAVKNRPENEALLYKINGDRR